MGPLAIEDMELNIGQGAFVWLDSNQDLRMRRAEQNENLFLF